MGHTKSKAPLKQQKLEWGTYKTYPRKVREGAKVAKMDRTVYPYTVHTIGISNLAAVYRGYSGQQPAADKTR